MQQTGYVKSLYIVPDNGEKTVQEQPYIDVDDEGIISDKHHGKGVERSILITSLHSYALLEAENIHVPYGSLGENLLIDYNPYHLPAGTQLHIADTILEITQNCTLCKHLAVFDKRIPKLLRHDRGIFAKVVKAGRITAGDTVYLL
ncbi:MAG: MOSC domain-containing protein [Sulfurovum sp.]|nr:MOSC domain-containing protein [Sulfurovum sp.]